MRAGGRAPSMSNVVPSSGINDVIRRRTGRRLRRPASKCKAVSILSDELPLADPRGSRRLGGGPHAPRRQRVPLAPVPVRRPPPVQTTSPRRATACPGQTGGGHCVRSPLAAAFAQYTLPTRRNCRVESRRRRVDCRRVRSHRRHDATRLAHLFRLVETVADWLRILQTSPTRLNWTVKSRWRRRCIGLLGQTGGGHCIRPRSLAFCSSREDDILEQKGGRGRTARQDVALLS